MTSEAIIINLHYRFSLYYSGLSCVYMFLRKGDMKSARLLLCGIAIYLTKLSICVALTGKSNLYSTNRL